MSEDDSRDTKTPDRQAQTPNYRSHLRTLETQTTYLLTDIEDDGELDADSRRSATRHCRELRAEIEYLRRHLPDTKRRPEEQITTIVSPLEAARAAARERERQQDGQRDSQPESDRHGHDHPSATQHDPEGGDRDE